MTGPFEGPSSYDVVFTEVAEAEADEAFLRMNGRSPDFAARWYAGLFEDVKKLSVFPGRCRLNEKMTELTGHDVRQRVYRYRYVTYRILFTLVDSDGDGTEDEVRILHVRDSARRPLGDEQDEG